MAREAPISSIRVAARLATGFVLDLVRLGGFGRDVIDGLLMAAITQANVAQVSRSPELQRAYATLDQPPPDELRRPVSISAVANSLRIPFETARRRISALADISIVQVAPKGVYIPQGPMNSPFYRMAAEAHYNLVRNLYLRLRAIDLFADLPNNDRQGFDPENPPVRLVIRMSTDYLLRLAEPLNQIFGDLVTALVFLDTMLANTEHIPDTVGGRDDGWGADSFVPDAERVPVRTVTLSNRLGVPQETVRRHLARLIADGRCERQDGAYIIPARVLAEDPFVRYILDNQSHLQRLFTGLADFGVLSEWESAVSAVRGAA